MTTDWFQRLARFSRRPLQEKAAALTRRVRLLTDARPRLQLALQALKAQDVRAFRGLVFGLLGPEQEFTVAQDGEETFVVLTSDQIISRLLFTEGNVFFPRLPRALGLLGPGFRLQTFIDVGANIGLIAIPAVKRGLAQRAIAIEPEPRNFRLLQANLHLNAVADRVVTHQLALGAEVDGLLRLELSSDNSGDHRVSVSPRPGRFGEEHRKAIVVPSRRFDDVVPDVDPQTSLLWMEAQGYEGFILQGAARAVGRRVPVLAEFCPYLMQRSGSFAAFAEVVSGYQRLFDVSRPEVGPLPATAATLASLRERLGEEGAYTDVLLC